ncbi:hypothetical protein MSG28_011506 [Choristoneura fumiferana]|uniref:Uncharacterized protein n=1 Tax=Choristoneura fumiferana TaxID=7141 RepID=A0ACC0JNI8_CHOFU|nr:hypothetical protein MSG28_011506 [Choristoneura fumiferana]
MRGAGGRLLNSMSSVNYPRRVRWILPVNGTCRRSPAPCASQLAYALITTRQNANESDGNKHGHPVGTLVYNRLERAQTDIGYIILTQNKNMSALTKNDEAPTMDVNNYQDGLGMGNPNGRPMNLQGVQASMPMPPSSR